jgi:hypothetical protein
LTNIAGLTGWWDASDSNTLFDAASGGSLVSADGTVARLEDKSGNSRHFTQSGLSTTRPVRKTAVRNSLDVLRFDGSNDWMTSSVSFTSIFTSTAGTCFVVAKAETISLNASSPYDNEMVLSENLGGQGFFAVRSTGSVSSFGYDSDYREASDTYAAGDWIVLTTWHDGTTLRVAVNDGTAQSASLATRVFLGSMRIGVNYDTFRFFDGDVGEIITYNQTLSQNDREFVQSDLMTKWGIT